MNPALSPTVKDPTLAFLRTVRESPSGDCTFAWESARVVGQTPTVLNALELVSHLSTDTSPDTFLRYRNGHNHRRGDHLFADQWAVVGSPVQFVASAAPANTAYPITSMRIYVDNVSVYLAYANKLDTSVALKAGGHSVVVQAWDSLGNVYKTAIAVSVN